MVSKKLKLIAALLAFFVVGAAGINWLSQPAPLKVRTAVVSKGSVAHTIANTKAGTLDACRRAGISPRLGGQIAKMPVTEGDIVGQGQILMEFWNADLMAQVSLAESELRASESKREQACIAADLSKREAGRQQTLRQRNLSSEEAIDKAESEARVQASACNGARAAVEVSQARLDVARAALDQTRLRAPFPGVVAEVNGEVGEFVTPSPVGIPTPPAVDLMDISCLYVSAPIDEVDAPKVGIDMTATITLDAFPDDEFAGRVRRIAPYVLDLEKQARTVDVEVEFLQPDECSHMLPGYSADIEVTIAEREDVLRIPTEAIAEGGRVLVINENGRAQQRTVDTGLSNWVWTEIRSGLNAGDVLVRNLGLEGLEDGVRVEAIETPDPND